ncbi:MAG: acetyl-CoA C-acyltransferase, partial [Actinomycetota bacterium]
MSVIVSGARTPIGRFGGGFRDVAAVDLGAAAIREALRRAGVQGDQVDYVVMGQVIQAGAGQITARQAAILAGIPKEVPAITINKVCLSGLNAVALADQLIRAGEVEVVVAGGMESMSGAPYLLPAARWGVRMGDAELVDSMIYDGLWSTFTGKHMGESSDEVNAELGIGREEQDTWSARSHRRAAAAWDEGRMADEIVAVEVPRRKGDPAIVDRDEGIRPQTTEESLAALRPAFKEGGTITAGNASQISDGGAALVVMSAERASALGAEPFAEIVAHGMSAERYPYLHTVPAIAVEHALKKAGLSAHDLGGVEINEAFAAVALNAARMLGLDESIVTPNGGAVALGHP